MKNILMVAVGVIIGILIGMLLRKPHDKPKNLPTSSHLAILVASPHGCDKDWQGNYMKDIMEVKKTEIDIDHVFCIDVRRRER